MNSRTVSIRTASPTAQCAGSLKGLSLRQGILAARLRFDGLTCKTTKTTKPQPNLYDRDPKPQKVHHNRSSLFVLERRAWIRWRAHSKNVLSRGLAWVLLGGDRDDGGQC